MRTACPVSCRFQYVVSLAGVAVALVLGSSMTSCGGSSAAPPPPLLSITTTALTDGTIGATYSQTIAAAGGVGRFSWSVSTGLLPHGLSMGPSSSSTATISGTPDTVQTGITFTVQVVESSSQSKTQSYSVNIKSTVAQTESGALQGVVAGGELVFRGIPYAAP